MADAGQAVALDAPADVLSSDGEPIGSARRHWVLVTAGVVVVLLILSVAGIYWNTAPDSPILVDSTPGQLALWMVEQSTKENPESLLGQLARTWGGADGLDETTALLGMRNLLVGYIGLAAVVAALGVITLALRSRGSRMALLFVLFGLDSLLLLIPTPDGDTTLALVLVSVFLMLGILLFAPGKVSRVLGFMVVLSALLMGWETVKAFTQSINYEIPLPLSGWAYTPYDTLEDSLAALQNGAVAAVIVDGKTVRNLVPASPDDTAETAAAMTYPDLRILSHINTDTRFLILPIEPNFPGRLSVVVRAADTGKWDSINALSGQPLGTVTG
ncbi:MAG: hypothetical protein K8I60_15905, partial [Anaerolineae bacterium]|nr:hypothetical protein [Anaerolineae bacterium]